MTPEERAEKLDQDSHGELGPVMTKAVAAAIWDAVAAEQERCLRIAISHIHRGDVDDPSVPVCDCEGCCVADEIFNAIQAGDP